MNGVDTTQQIIALVIGLLGLVSSGVGVFVGVKNAIENQKDKTIRGLWNTIMVWADAAMKSVEGSKESGATKKQMAIDAVIAAAKASNVDISDFLPQLSEYIEKQIEFFNTMKK